MPLRDCWKLSVAAVLAVHCGGAVEPSDSAETDGSTDASAETAVDAASACTFPNGVRICSETCGADFKSCEVCVQFKDVDGRKMAVGTCTTDGDKMLGARCPRCSEPGYLCAQQEIDDTLVCVNPAICETQKARGDSTRPCYWPDVTPWSGAEPIPNVGCPAAGLDLCGGGCGDACPTGTSCFGRSPSHPIGICARVFREGGGALGCRRGSFGCNTGEACFIYKVDPTQQMLANEHGFCMQVDRCISIKNVLPGGAFCTGVGGTEL
ncbi:MAG: hypothetical protein HYV09_41135 [Deltaproteobacteria bacterium]|nr:hypothetical protein [Deltaproteobacteria bacterium]